MTELELLTPTRIDFSKRKTLSILINLNGEMIVKAPLRCEEKVINKFISEKSGWIIKKRLEFSSKKEKTISFLDGEKISILGKEHEINLLDISNVKLTEDKLFLPRINSKEKLREFLKRYSKKVLKDRLDQISKLTGLSYKSFTISSAKTNWGSCSFKNVIHLNYRLLLTNNSVLNYVILHELCHTIEKNHSKKFWKLVETASPNYKDIKKDLNNYSYLLNCI